LPGLHEVHFGDWTGLGWEEVRTRFNVSAFQWLEKLEQAAIPNAENAKIFRARVEPCVEQILRDHPGQGVAVVCHGGTIRMILSILLDLPLSRMASFEIEYASVTQVHQLPHKTEVQLLNFTPWRDVP
jgi:broad specificity phosphatase PhoE